MANDALHAPATNPREPAGARTAGPRTL